MLDTDTIGEYVAEIEKEKEAEAEKKKQKKWWAFASRCVSCYCIFIINFSYQRNKTILRRCYREGGKQINEAPWNCELIFVCFYLYYLLSQNCETYVQNHLSLFQTDEHFNYYRTWGGKIMQSIVARFSIQLNRFHIRTTHVTTSWLVLPFAFFLNTYEKSF